MSWSTRARTQLRVCALFTPVLVAACLGGRNVRPAVPKGPPVVPPVVVKSTDSVPVPVVVKPADTTTRSDPVRDSLFRVSDSLKKLATADSAKPTNKKPVTKTPAKKTKECLLDFNDSPPETRYNYLRQNDSSTIIMVGGGFAGHCVGEKNIIKADSAEYFELNGVLNLIGRVTYEEKAEFRATANHATYLLREGKLYADGNVVATQLKTGSIFSGPNIEYFRVMPDIRTTSRLYAPNSPQVQIHQKDSLGKELPPVRVSASVMQDNGDSVLFAWGSVTIQRTDIQGRSDSASYDKPTGLARLIRGANIQSTSQDQPFTLSGDTIDLFSRDSVLDRVLSKHVAKAKSGEVNMSAEMIDLRLVDKKISRAFVYGPGRAKATTKEQTLEADSMDIFLPNQRIQELRAHGLAVAVSKPDSTKIRSEENDVLKGDTVIALFDSTRSPTDTSAKVQIRRIIAGGNASSKVQVASRQGPTFPPAVNYIRGKHLVVSFDSGQVRDIQVDSSANGNYFEPMPDSLADSTLRNKPRKPPGLSVVPTPANRLPLGKVPAGKEPAGKYPAPFAKPQTVSLDILTTKMRRTQ